jgi:hypothetical protein
MSVLLLANSLAHADPDEVEGLVREGVALRKAGKDREALDTFRRAASVQRTPRVLGQIGLAELALGLWVEADADLRESLAASNDAWIQKNRPNLEQTLKTIGRHVGTLSVWGTPQGAEILVNGKFVGKVPTNAPIRVLVGAANLVVRANGYEAMSRPIEVQPDSRNTEQVDLVPTPVAQPTAVGAQVPPPPSSPAGTTLEVQSGPRNESTGAVTPSPFYERWWFWAAVGVVAAGTITTAVVLSRDNKQSCSGTCTTWVGGN